MYLILFRFSRIPTAIHARVRLLVRQLINRISGSVKCLTVLFLSRRRGSDRMRCTPYYSISNRCVRFGNNIAPVYENVMSGTPCTPQVLLQYITSVTSTIKYTNYYKYNYIDLVYYYTLQFKRKLLN